MSKEDVSKDVLRIMQETSKPYSVNDIVEKCGKDCGKAAIQRALNSLLFREKIVEKTFGKQKIYFIRQADSSRQEIKAELQLLSQKHTALETSLRTKQDRIRALESRLKSFASIPNLKTLENEKKSLQEAIDEVNSKLDNLKAKQGAKISADDVKKVDKKHAILLSTYRKRKRICTDLIEAIMEGYPKPKKQLIEDVGIETDEAVGFVAPH